MRIILDTTNNEDRIETELEVDITAFEAVIIQKKGTHFQLALKTYYDAFFSPKSAIVYVLASFETYEKCLDLYQAIRAARRAGEIEFDLESYLEKIEQQETLQQGNLSTV